MLVNWPERVWVNSPPRRWVQAREIAFFKRSRDMAPGCRVLEIGCGRGAGARLVARAFAPSRLDALDLDPAMLRLVKEMKNPAATRILPVAGDAQRLPYRDASLDAVFNFGIVHHLEDWRAGLGEVARVLRPGGAFYIEEIYPDLYANWLTRRILVHPREDRFQGPQFREELARQGLGLLPGYRESRFGLLGVAVKNPHAQGAA